MALPSNPVGSKLSEENLSITKVTKEFSEGMKPISDGYGEYIVFRLKNSQPSPLSEEEYEKVYSIFLRYHYSPYLGEGKKSEKIQAEISKLDSSYKLTFIPRTMYELFFLREAIEEERGVNYPFLKEGACRVTCKGN